MQQLGLDASDQSLADKGATLLDRDEFIALNLKTAVGDDKLTQSSEP
jgi:hypothetical protein